MSVKPVMIAHGGAKTRGVRHSISAACRIMEEKPRLVVARSGERFALEHGLEMCSKGDLVSQEQYQEWKEEKQVLDRSNTAGCVALDVNGNLVAGTPTGGTTGQQQGRVGDTTLVDMAVTDMTDELSEPAVFLRKEQPLAIA